MQTHTIQESDIKNWTSATSFARGKQYYEQGAIVSPWQQGGTLKAKCWGSLPHPYHLWVTLTANSIHSGDCSCPVGTGGRCKHIAALLLTWLHEPDSFQEIEPLEQALDQKEKADLIFLIHQMIGRYPDLEELVYLSATADATATTPINPDLIRRQVGQAFRHGDYGHAYYGAANTIASELETIMQQASLYREQGDWLNTAVIICTVLDELRTQYTNIYDHDGDLGSLFWHGSEQLAECLEQISETAARHDILDTLVGIILEDIKVGGYGFADTAYAIVLEQTTVAERAEIVTRVEEELADIKSLDDFSSKWRAEAYGRFLLNLQANSLTDEQFIQLCRRTGLHKQLVERLLQLGRVDEAISAARTASDYDLLSLADLFVTYEHETIAEGLVWERTGTSQDIRLDGWLKKHAINKGDWPKAITHTENQFWLHPSTELYQELKTIAEKLGDWPSRQQTIRQRLDKEQKYALLTRIHLLEDNIDAALTTLAKVAPMQAVSWGQSGGLSIEVAQAAEKMRPQAAISLYQQKVERLIAARGRDNYAQAAEYLKRVKALYQQLQNLEAWQQTIQVIRGHKPRLPALLDELKRVGL